MNIIKRITKWYISISSSVIFTICTWVYFEKIKELKKPAGMGDALDFLFSSPKEYAWCLLCGSVAKILFCMMIFVCIASFILVACEFFLNEENSTISKVKSIVRVVVNVIMTVAMGIFQSKIITYFWVLVGAVIFLTMIVFLLVKNKN